MYFQYENEYLVKRRIYDGTSGELADIVEKLEDDIYDVLHTTHILHINDKRRIFRPTCPPRRLQRPLVPHRTPRTQKPRRGDSRV